MTLLDGSGLNFTGILIPFLLTIAVTSITYFVMKAVHRKRHPGEEDAKEAERRKREKEKLRAKTMADMNDRLRGKTSDEEKAPNGLRSGKHNKKKKK